MTTRPHPHADLFAVDMTSAMRTCARRLREEFDGIFSVETVERFLHESYADLEARATVSRFTPLIAERQARERLRAFAGAEPTLLGKPVVLFVSTHNAGRSQVAQGFLRHVAGDRALAWTGGAHPSHSVDPLAIEVMREIGIEIDPTLPRLFTDDTVRAADVVVTMGVGDACPLYPGHKYADWAQVVPFGRTLEAARATREEIRRRVGDLASGLGVAA